VSYYVTTAIDYVNGRPHLGHAYEKIAADMIARHQRLLLGPGDVFYLTGTDEHGAKIEKVAREAGVSPAAWCDEKAAQFKEAWELLGVAPDRFIRTTDADHEAMVQRIFSRLLQQGDIAKARYEGWYCRSCEEFKLERDMAEDRHCPVHGTPTEWQSEENYVFLVSRYKERVRAWLESDARPLEPDWRCRETLNLLEGFPDVSVSRQSLKWGVPVAEDPDHVIYVWIDALSNYLSGIGYMRDEALFQYWWPADLHLVGKDITKFHAIIWPALLLALDLPLPRKVYAHGWVLVGQEKMSKSTGVVVDPVTMAREYGADALRYYLLREIVFGKDGEFTQEAFENRVNADLANNFGNALHRMLTFAERHFEMRVARPQDLPAEVSALAAAAAAARDAHREAMGRLALHEALGAVWGLLDETNLFIDRMAPWALAKAGDLALLQQVLWGVFESLRVAAIMASSAIPGLALKLWEQLGPGQELASARWEDTVFDGTPDRTFALVRTGPVYPRIGVAAAKGAKA